MNHSERFVGVPVTLNAMLHEDFKAEDLLVYVSIRSFASLSPEKDNFCFCFPSLESIGKKFRLPVETVRTSIAWLEENGYLYKHPRGQRSITYTIVIERDRFLQVRELEGKGRAIEINETWMEKQQQEARKKNKQPRP